jgi:hypothetical protein
MAKLCQCFCFVYALLQHVAPSYLQRPLTQLFPTALAGGVGEYSNVNTLYTVFYQVYCTLFYIENNAEIFPVHYTWKVAEKGLKMAFMMNIDAKIISCKIILEKKYFF